MGGLIIRISMLEKVEEPRRASLGEAPRGRAVIDHGFIALRGPWYVSMDLSMGN
jgi:hypothetical protein